MEARLILLSLAGCAAVTFTLEPSHERCLSETIPEKSLLTGDWKIGGGDQGTVQVRSPDKSVLFHNSQPEGHFSVTAAAAGQHHICVRNEGTAAREVILNVKQAVEVDDHNVIAKEEHVQAIEAELDRMKKMATHVYEEMVFMRDRADAMHTTSEQTRARLFWTELVMMVTLLVMGLWQARGRAHRLRHRPAARARALLTPSPPGAQIHYLKRYFQAKKIL